MSDAQDLRALAQWVRGELPASAGLQKGTAAMLDRVAEQLSAQLLTAWEQKKLLEHPTVHRILGDIHELAEIESEAVTGQLSEHTQKYQTYRANAEKIEAEDPEWLSAPPHWK